ncbi:hypothetical protein ONZ45_g14062 [Pleurotus djamor]|nr:hypothetical protein ONZ45_g14062 [Pleurotus djamor]
MADETIEYLAGPCPASEFFEDCIPAPKKQMPKVDRKDYFKDKNVKNEEDLSKHLCNLINGTNEDPPLFDGWKLINTSKHKDRTSKESTRVDLCLVETAKFDPHNRNNKSIMDMELELNVKRANTFNDIFGNHPDVNIDHAYRFETTTGDLMRGQLAMYASEIYSHQHRTHLYMLYFFHPFVRILRWDRSGVIVTERLKYTEDCTSLITFLWRYTQLDDVERGHDPTVSLATDEETKLARRLLKDWAPSKPRDVLKIQVPDPDADVKAGDDAIRSFLVWGAIIDPLSPFGRGTRGYAAIEVKEGQEPSKPMFLKEQWRAITVNPEVGTLKTLNKAKIKHVPTLLCGGDFSNHKTLTDQVAKEKWGYRGDKLVSRVLTRLVVIELGRPLSPFTSSKSMIYAIYHAFQAHRDVYNICGILHRDISSGNILILPDGSGLLIDWDLAKEVAKLVGPGRTPERTGTWAFMSVKLSNQPHNLHSVHDDIESFFWVILYFAVRYTPHNRFDDLCNIVKKLFEECFLDGEDLTGGSNKTVLISSGTLDGSPFEFSCGALDGLIFDWRKRLGDMFLEETRRIAAERKKNRKRGKVAQATDAFQISDIDDSDNENEDPPRS